MTGDWRRQLQRRAYTLAQWEHAMKRAREQFRPLHRDVQARAPRRPAIDPSHSVDRENICKVTAFSTAMSLLTADEWEALTAWHRDALSFYAVIPHMLPLLCDDCVKRIGDSSIFEVDDDEDRTNAVDTTVRLLDRFTGAGYRRVVHILGGLLENGTVTTITVSRDGEVTADQEGLRAAPNDRDRVDRPRAS